MKIKDYILLTKNKDYKKVLKYISKVSKNSSKKSHIVTINSEIIMLGRSDIKYEKVLKEADLIVPDGVGVLWAGKMFGHSLDSRVHGADLIEKTAKLSEKTGITIGLVGGDKNVALEASICLKKTYPKAKINFAVEEWNKIKGTKKCDVLFVALGSPKQEVWINKNLPNINVEVAIGIGGAFDFLSGKVRRAPKWIQRTGLEWLFRLIIQPWRIKRQVALVKFALLVIKERFV